MPTRSEAWTRGGAYSSTREERTADAAEVHRVPASARYALVHLGVCSAPVAPALAAVIARGADQ
ncbi:hypothetical protein GCM10027073_34930 [Streptomyces chlorus]